MEPGSSNIFKGMLEGEVHSDITIQAKGGSAMAHRSVLACVSPVFAAMFRYQMQEQQTSVLKVSDMSIAALRLFLKVIYCGFDEVDKDSLEVQWEEVFAACHKYEVPFLEACTAFMTRTLSVGNCWEYLDSAMAWYEKEGMVSVCLKFMYLNCTKIINSPDFERAANDYPELVVDFIRYTMPKSKG